MSSFGYNYGFNYYPLVVQNSLTTTTLTNSIEIVIYPKWFHQMTVSWTIPSDWGNCLFDVYRGPGEDGPFLKLTQTPINGFYLKDITTQVTSKSLVDFYVVDCILPNNGGRIQSKAVDLQKTPRDWVNLRLKDIQRREWLLLTRFIGVESLVFRAMSYGARCKACWNEDTEKIMIEKCIECMGTSFEGGYFPPYTTWIQYEQTPEDLEFAEFGKFEPGTIKGWTIAIPEYHDRDLVLRVSDWKLFRIDQNVKTELQTKSVRQIFQLRELSRQDVEWNLIQRISNSIYPDTFK